MTVVTDLSSTGLADYHRSKAGIVEKPSGSPIAASLLQNAIPVEAIWKLILLQKPRKNAQERFQTTNLTAKLMKLSTCHALVMIMYMILNPQPPTAVVDLLSYNSRSVGDPLQVCRGSFHQLIPPVRESSVPQ